MDSKHLIVIGAGPKGVAIGAKLKALSEAGFEVPMLTIFDHRGVAANWTGERGRFTDGNQALASSPLRDVGFPYGSTEWGDITSNRAVDQEMLLFSWQAYLVARRTMGAAPVRNYFASWVDRGGMNPKLHEWASYLDWVTKLANCEPDRREVVAVSENGKQWEVTVEDGAGRQEAIIGDGLVITGPGGMKKLTGYDRKYDSPYVTDAENFWQHLDQVTDEEEARFGIVGSGGAAASIAMALLQRATIGNKRFLVEILTPDGVVYSRGESYDENHHYSDPAVWRNFNDCSKKKFNEHTNSGVFSLEAKRELNMAETLETISASVDRIEFLGPRRGVNVYMENGKFRHYDRVVIALGFDNFWWKKLFDAGFLATALPYANGEIDEKKVRAEGIGDYLELRTLNHPLHLPMLAESRGPGFPSLMCLGLLSDCILHPYIFP